MKVPPRAASEDVGWEGGSGPHAAHVRPEARGEESAAAEINGGPESTKSRAAQTRAGRTCGTFKTGAPRIENAG